MWGWRTGGLMLIGMALFKLGVLTAKRSKRFYINLASIGILIGFFVVAFGVFRNFSENWSVDYSMFLGSQFNYWGSILIALGYIGLIMLIVGRFNANKLTGALALVGRSALSNYLLQTLICTIIFYGHGFGLFGQEARKFQILIVLGVWIVQIILTLIWFRRFQFGPVEWLWRSLTYFKLQCLRISGIAN